MTLYQNVATGQFGLTASNLRALLPHVSFAPGADLTDHGFAPYALTPAPSPTWYQSVVEIEPLNGQQQWGLEDTTAALPDLKAQRLEDLATLRKQKTQEFAFNGMPLKLDPDTENAISKAIQSLARQPEGTTISWEVSRGVVMLFDLATLEAIGDAAFLHVQACFTNVATKTALILGTETLEDLVEVDLTTGWPE